MPGVVAKPSSFTSSTRQRAEEHERFASNSARRGHGRHYRYVPLLGAGRAGSVRSGDDVFGAVLRCLPRTGRPGMGDLIASAAGDRARRTVYRGAPADPVFLQQRVAFSHREALELASPDCQRDSVSRKCGCCDEWSLLVLTGDSGVDGNSGGTVAALRALAGRASTDDIPMAACSLPEIGRAH